MSYQVKHYSLYEASQKQRQVERAIRKQKNRILVAEATGDKEQLQIAQIRLGRLNEKYLLFSKATGQRTQRERAWVAGFGRGQAARAGGTYRKSLRRDDENAIIKPAGSASMNTGRVLEYDPEADFSIVLPGYNDNVIEGLSNASLEVATLGSLDAKEHLAVVNLQSGMIDYRECGQAGEVGGKEFWDYIRKHPQDRFAFVHNHNIVSSFSETDLRTLVTTENIDVFAAIQIDGLKYIAEKKMSYHAKGSFDKLYAEQLEKINQMSRIGAITPGERTSLREATIVENLLRDFTKGLIILDGRKKLG